MALIHTCVLNIHGVRLRITSCHPGRIHRLKGLCSLFLLPVETKTPIAVEWTDEDEWDLLSLLAEHDLFAFHAAAYENSNGKGILLPGSGGSGKSTIAFSALRSDYPVVGDDVALCRRDTTGVSLLPFKGHIFLKQEGETKSYDVSEHYVNNVFRATSLSVIVFPHIVSERESAINRISDKRAVFAGLLRTAVWAKDNGTRERQASILTRLCMFPSYDLLLGDDHKRSPELAVELLNNI